MAFENSEFLKSFIQIMVDAIVCKGKKMKRKRGKERKEKWNMKCSVAIY